MDTPFDSILLVAFGGPTSGDQGYEFVKGIVGGRPQAEPRVREVARHYEHLGGSPFNDLTFRQAKALEDELARRGITVPVRTGMRHWSPWVADVVREMAEHGHRRTLSVILAPHQCWISWDWYKDTVSQACAALGDKGPSVAYADPWWTEPDFIQANADRIREALARAGSDGAGARLIFTAHAIPIDACKPCQSGERRCPYTPQFEESARLVATAVGCPGDYVTCYQSQAAHGTPWTEPDVNAVLRRLAADGVRRVLIAPIGFVCDHVEVLYDLDVSARKTCAEVGIAYTRAGTVGSHPAFIRLLADRIVARIRGAERLTGPLVLA
jgi:ferrochelatase